MKKSLPIVVLFAALAAGLWLNRETPTPAPLHSYRLFALGTLIDIQIAGPMSDTRYSALEGELIPLLNAFETRWSVLRDGALAQLNRQLETAASATFADGLYTDLRLAQQICRNSGGRYDPAIGRWIALWGFEDEEKPREQPPTETEIVAARAPSWCEAELSDQIVTLGTVGVRLNFGGMAKGRAVDLLLTHIRNAGFPDALVNAGGDLQVSGQRGERAWRIGIRDPRAPGEQKAIAAISLHDGEALFSSGDYERFFTYDGQRYHHLIDPHTGQPARRAISATVLHTDAALADAAATALFVAGPEDAPRVAADLGIEMWMVIAPDGTPTTSPALEQRLEWLDTDAAG